MDARPTTPPFSSAPRECPWAPVRPRKVHQPWHEVFGREEDNIVEMEGMSIAGERVSPYRPPLPHVFAPNPFRQHEHTGPRVRAIRDTNGIMAEDVGLDYAAAVFNARK